jgi:hypothetical protein
MKTIERLLGSGHFHHEQASAPSRLIFRVEPLQFGPCFVDGELPIDSSLLFVDTG